MTSLSSYDFQYVCPELANLHDSQIVHFEKVGHQNGEDTNDSKLEVAGQTATPRKYLINM